MTNNKLSVVKGDLISLVTGKINGKPYFYAHPDFIEAMSHAVNKMREGGYLVKAVWQ